MFLLGMAAGVGLAYALAALGIYCDLAVRRRRHRRASLDRVLAQRVAEQQQEWPAEVAEG